MGSAQAFAVAEKPSPVLRIVSNAGDREGKPFASVYWLMSPRIKYAVPFCLAHPKPRAILSREEFRHV